MRNMHTTVTITFILLLLSGNLLAQQDEIKVKLQQKVDGQLKSFEKTYHSREEMENDPELKEFKKDLQFYYLSDSTANHVEIITDPDMDSTVNRIQRLNKNMIFVNDGGHDSTVVIKLESHGDGAYRVWQNGQEIDTAMVDTIKLIKLDSGHNVYLDSKDGGVFEFTTKSKGAHAIVVKSGNINMTTFDMDIRVRELTGLELKDAGLKASAPLSDAIFSLYPNPSDGNIHVEFSGNSVPTYIHLYDMTGRSVYSEFLSSFDGQLDSRIDLSGFENGMYIFEIKQQDKTLRKKILLQRN